MLKSVLKCIESIRILKNGLTFLKIPRANLGGGGRGGGLAKLVKSQLFEFFFNPSLKIIFLGHPVEFWVTTAPLIIAPVDSFFWRGGGSTKPVLLILLLFYCTF